jgi:hypothetical protein
VTGTCAEAGAATASNTAAKTERYICQSIAAPRSACRPREFGGQRATGVAVSSGQAGAAFSWRCQSLIKAGPRDVKSASV